MEFGDNPCTGVGGPDFHVQSGEEVTEREREKAEKRSIEEEERKKRDKQKPAPKLGYGSGKSPNKDAPSAAKKDTRFSPEGVPMWPNPSINPDTGMLRTSEAEKSHKRTARSMGKVGREGFG